MNNCGSDTISNEGCGGPLLGFDRDSCCHEQYNMIQQFHTVRYDMTREEMIRFCLFFPSSITTLRILTTIFVGRINTSVLIRLSSFKYYQSTLYQSFQQIGKEKVSQIAARNTIVINLHADERKEVRFILFIE